MGQSFRHYLCDMGDSQLAARRFCCASQVEDASWIVGDNDRRARLIDMF